MSLIDSFVAGSFRGIPSLSSLDLLKYKLTELGSTKPNKGVSVITFLPNDPCNFILMNISLSPVLTTIAEDTAAMYEVINSFLDFELLADELTTLRQKLYDRFRL